MKHLEYINLKIREAIKDKPVVCIGQNIDSGSFIGGLTRGLEVGPGGKIINATCAENTLVGLGFGIALNGGHAILFMKQLDFLLLGIDQVVNTWNAIRNRQVPITGSFTIIPVIIDSGWQGPQSSLNALDAICSIGRTEGYYLNGKTDIDFTLSSKLLDPGFRIIAPSHKLSNQELITRGGKVNEEHGFVEYFGFDDYFDYYSDPDVVIISTGSTLGDALKLSDALLDNQKTSRVFQITNATGFKFDGSYVNLFDIRRLCVDETGKRCGKLVIFDDSKSEISVGDKMISDIFEEGDFGNVMVLHYKHPSRYNSLENWLEPNSDSTNWNIETILKEIL